MKLLDVCEFIIDCPHSTARDEGAGYPLIRTPNVGKGRLLLEGVHRVSKDIYDKRNIRGVPQEGDLIFAREAPAGNVAVIQKGQNICLGQRTVLLRPNRELADSDYLAYYLLTPQQQYKLLGTANGATVAHVNLPVIRDLDVTLPSLDVQKKIAAILSAYDDLIENNRKQIKLLEEAAGRLYREWFVELRFPGHETTPVTDGVPEGWSAGVLGDIAIFKRGKTITRAQIHAGKVPVVAGGLQPAYYHNEANTSAPVITVSGSGANAGFARLYSVDVFASDCSFADSRTTPYLYFVYCFVTANKAAFNALQKGAAQPHVYAKDINALKLQIPPKGIMQMFCELVSPYYGKIKILQRQIEKAAEARDRLLPKLMSGEIEV